MSKRLPLISGVLRYPPAADREQGVRRTAICAAEKSVDLAERVAGVSMTRPPANRRHIVAFADRHIDIGIFARFFSRRPR